MRATAAVLLALAVACGAPMRSATTSRYVGIILNARDLGDAELDRLAARDATLADYLAREGDPDFLLEANARDVELIYVRASRVVLFRQPAADAPTLVGTTEPLPTSTRTLLPPDLRAGTGEPMSDPGTACWTIDVGDERCRTCCAAPAACALSCSPRDAG